MNRKICAAVAGAIFAGWAGVAAAGTIDVPWDGVNGGANPFGEGNTAYYGQTFQALAGTAESLTFYMNHASGGDQKFHLLITEISNVGGQINPTNVLFESTTITVPVGASMAPINVDLGGLALTEGTSYAWIVDAFVEFDGTGNTSHMGIPNPLDSYSGGHWIFLNIGGGDRNSHFASNWSEPTAVDLAFQMEFSEVVAAPEPGALALLGLGFATLSVARRRRSR